MHAPPASTRFIPLMSPAFRDEDIDVVVHVLRSGMLVQGKHVEALEAAACEYTGAAHAVALSNGTATLHLALLALGIGVGDEVIVPALSYVATANVVEIVGATPVFVDVEPETFNINPSLIEAAITPRTRAIMPVHEFGLAADANAIMRIAEKHGLPVIEDAACALGARQNGRHVGTFGEFGSFSFHPRKAITAGEGGLLLTNRADLAARLRVLRNHGVEMQDGQMEFVAAGFNYRMTDFQAALIESQWPRIDEQIAHKRELAAVYDAVLDTQLFRTPAVPEDRPHTWQTYHVVISPGVDRTRLMQALREEAGVGTNYGAQCMPAVRYYQNKYSLDCARLFPTALEAYTRGLALPIYEKLSAADVRRIAEACNHHASQSLA